MNVNGMGTERMRKTRETLNAWRAESQAKARRAVRITDNYAHDHPWRMLTTAGALALVAGLLISSSVGKKKRPVAIKNAPQPRPRKPEIKVVKAKAKPKHSGWDALHALTPLVLMGLKAWQSSQAAKASAGAAPVNVNPPPPATEFP